MSFLSKLGFLGKLGAIGAAPFTGGASLAALPALSMAGKVVGDAGQAMTANRGAAEDAQLGRDRLALEGRSKLQEELMQRAMFEQKQRGQSQRDLARTGMMINGGQPSNMAGPGAFQVQGLKNAEWDALQHTMAPRQYDLSQLERPTLFTPTPAKKASIWEKILGIAGPAMSVGGFLTGGRDGGAS